MRFEPSSAVSADRQIEILETRLASAALIACLSAASSFPCWPMLSWDSGPTLVKLAQVSQPLLKRAQLCVIERPGRLLPVSGNKGRSLRRRATRWQRRPTARGQPSSSAMRKLIGFIDPERLAGGRNHRVVVLNLPYENRQSRSQGRYRPPTRAAGARFAMASLVTAHLDESPLRRSGKPHSAAERSF